MPMITVRLESNEERIRVRRAACAVGKSMQQFCFEAIMRNVGKLEKVLQDNQDQENLVPDRDSWYPL